MTSHYTSPPQDLPTLVPDQEEWTIPDRTDTNVTGNLQTESSPETTFEDPTTDEPTDGELLIAVRAGDMDAYGDLFARHRANAVKAAWSVLRNTDQAHEATSEAFSSILSAIRGGSGPVGTFRGYLRSTVTRAAYKIANQRNTEIPVEEHPETAHLLDEDFTDHMIDPLLREAFISLPRRWQMAIWYLDVEDHQPRTVAPLFGLSPNALIALHRRAKKGLTRAYNANQE